MTLCSFSLAQPTLQRLLKEIQDFRFQKVEESRALDENRHRGPSGKALVEGQPLLSYTRWKVRSADPGLYVEMQVYQMADATAARELFSRWGGPGRPLDLPVANLYWERHLVFARGRYFFHLAGAPEESSRMLASRLVAAVETGPRVTWLYGEDPEIEAARRETISFLRVVRDSFLFTLFIAMLTLGAGLLTGLVRHRLLKSYPKLKERDEMIRLKITDQ